MTGISVLFLNMIRFGPLEQKWTMKYEARHNYFKNVAQNIGNNIKITWTPANRHQLLQCYYQTSQESLLTDIMDIDWSMEVAHYSKVNTVYIYTTTFLSSYLMLFAGTLVAVQDQPLELQSGTDCFRYTTS